MPSIKAKTHKATKKRFKVTATGKVMHKACGSSHLNSHKSGKQIRRLRKKKMIRVAAVAQKYRRSTRQGPEVLTQKLDIDQPETGVDVTEPTA
jgi:large subunit ribosomal protein L35